jgi:hypothetical protein
MLSPVDLFEETVYPIMSTKEDRRYYPEVEQATYNNQYKVRLNGVICGRCENARTLKHAKRDSHQ